MSSSRLRTATKPLLLATVLAFAGAMPGCGSDDPTQVPTSKPASKDHVDFVLGPHTKQLSEADIAALREGGDKAQTLHFSNVAQAKFAPGDVLMAGITKKTPVGLLRVVLKTEPTADGVDVLTEQAPLQLAFTKLNAHVERTLDMEPQLPAQVVPLIGFNIGGTTPLKKFYFNGDDDPKTVEDQLLFNDTFTGQVGVTLDIDFDWGFAEAVTAGVKKFLECTLASLTLGIVGDCPDLSLPTLKATLVAGISVATAFDHSGAASANYKVDPFDIGKPVQLEPIPLGPLVFLPEIAFTGTTEGRAGSYARIKGRSKAALQATVTASTANGFNVKKAPTKEFFVDDVESYLDAHVMTSVGPEIKFLAYGAIGPSFGVAFRSDLDVDRTRKADCYRASQSLDAYFGFIVRFPWRAIGEYFSGGNTDIGEKVEWVASKFGLDKTLVDKRVPFNLASEQVGQGTCKEPPAGILPPGAPKDDTFANPPFKQWSRRWDEPGVNFDFSTSPTQARTKLVLGVDGHFWAPASPSPVLRRIASDGRLLSAVRYFAPVPMMEKEEPLAVADVLDRLDLHKWVLFENGTIARLAGDNAFLDAVKIDVPITQFEEVHLRRGAVRPDGRTALVFGIREVGTSHDHRMVLVEMDKSGVVLRSRALGAPTVDPSEIQGAFFTTGQVMYLPDGTLLIGGDHIASKGATQHCMLFAIKDDGTLAFGTILKPGGGSCEFGGIAKTDNGDLLLTGNDGSTFSSSGLSIVLDSAAKVRSTAKFQFGGDSVIFPTSITRLPTSGYVLAGRDTLSATRDGQFVARLDAQGVPLVATGYFTPENVTLGHLDAFLTKDAGVLFASLADWNDFGEGRDMSRLFAGKAFAKDGVLPFAAASGISAVTLPVTGNTLTTFQEPLTEAFSNVVVTVKKTPLRAEPLNSAETVFAP